jgi:hypothetical protein
MSTNATRYTRVDGYVRRKPVEVTVTYRPRIGWDCEICDARSGELIGWTPNSHSTYNAAMLAALDCAEKGIVVEKREVAA